MEQQQNPPETDNSLSDQKGRTQLHTAAAPGTDPGQLANM